MQKPAGAARQPVDLVELQAGHKLQQWQLPDRPTGHCFAELGTPAEALGNNPAGRVANVHVAPCDVVLRSTAAPIVDTWTVPGQAYAAKGGGVQYFTARPGDYGRVASDVSPGASLLAKYNHLTPEARATRMESLAEANASRRLNELESSIAGAHFVQKHGAQTMRQSQLERAQYGKNPTTGVVETYPNGNPKIPYSATGFFSSRDQLSTISRAQKIFASTGDVTLAERPIKFNYLMGEGYRNTSLLYG